MKIFNCIPKQVVIGWQTYDVDIREPDKDLPVDISSYVKPNDSLILINSTISDDNIEFNLLGSVIEACNVRNDLHLSEGQVLKISNVLASFIVQNPGLLR